MQFSLETRLENTSQKISMASRARKMCCILVGDLHASICILTFQFSHANGIMIAGMPLLDENVMAAIKICRCLCRPLHPLRNPYSSRMYYLSRRFSLARETVANIYRYRFVAFTFDEGKGNIVAQ